MYLGYVAEKLLINKVIKLTFNGTEHVRLWMGSIVIIKLIRIICYQTIVSQSLRRPACIICSNTILRNYESRIIFARVINPQLILLIFYDCSFRSMISVSRMQRKSRRAVKMDIRSSLMFILLTMFHERTMSLVRL